MIYFTDYSLTVNKNEIMHYTYIMEYASPINKNEINFPLFYCMIFLITALNSLMLYWCCKYI